MELFIIMAVALSYMIQQCGGTGVCSSSTFGGDIGLKNNDGAVQFPVFHWKHPCILQLDGSSSMAALHPAAANLLAGASPVVANDEIHKGKFFMVISLGTPAVFNLVTIDTGSTLSWVQCRPCQISCKTHAEEAGPILDPRNSSTYQRVSCSSHDCAGVHERLGVPFGCEQETDTCLYRLRFGSGPLAQYSVGRLGKDKLGLTLADDDDGSVVDDFIFGCSEDVSFKGREAGVVGFGNDSFSFFNQVMAARQTGGYNAFSYCLPGEHDSRGFLYIGPYARDGLEFTNLVLGYGQGHRPFVYSLQQLDMMVDGQRLDVDPRAYVRQMMIVDSGTQPTFLQSPVFDALDKAVTAAMTAKGYARHRLTNDDEHSVCYEVTSSNETSVDWGDLPALEMKFTGTTLKLPPQNAFNHRVIGSHRLVCLPFQPRDAGVRGVQILGSRVIRSFRVVFDLQARMLGFQPHAC